MHDQPRFVHKLDMQNQELLPIYVSSIKIPILQTTIFFTYPFQGHVTYPYTSTSNNPISPFHEHFTSKGF